MIKNKKRELLIKACFVTAVAAVLTLNLYIAAKAADPLTVPAVQDPTQGLTAPVVQPEAVQPVMPIEQPVQQPVQQVSPVTDTAPNITSHSIDNADAKKENTTKKTTSENIKDISAETENEQVFDEDKEAKVDENKREYPKWQSIRKKPVKDYDYSIKVNKRTNTVTIYIKEEDGSLTPYKAMVCSIGRAGHETPEGKGYRTSDYYDWRLMVDNTYGRYAVRFNGSIMFHSVPYYESKKDSLEWQDYNKLGKPASLGCIRLAVADAKWIFDNCRRGTEVEVYSGPASTDPLGTPKPIKLDTNSEYRDWDPTDLTPENPWLVPVE